MDEHATYQREIKIRSRRSTRRQDPNVLAPTLRVPRPLSGSSGGPSSPMASAHSGFQVQLGEMRCLLITALLS